MKAVLAIILFWGTTAQAFPTKPIRIVVPFGPGGVADITARVVAPKMAEALGQQVLIENKPSAGGIVAGQEVARAPADGHTLLLISNGTAVSKALFKSLPYEPASFSMVSTIGYFPLVILADPKSPFQGAQDVVAEAKRNPGRLNAGTIGIGSTQNLAAELFKSSAGIDIQVVPYKATGEVVAAAKSGDAHVAFEILAPALSHIRSGNLRALAITSAKRFPGLPEVPTAIEQGIAGYDVASWNGLAAPPGTPGTVIAVLHGEMVKALSAPDVQKRFAELGVEPRSSLPHELRTFFAAETERWAKVVEAAKIPKQ
jgi:tripartite-type tricarboxylate transporter receptor subunit TctC